MKKEMILKLLQNFEKAAQLEESVEYWMVRDLQTFFEYAEWENFTNVIEKAKIACENSKHLKNNHFRDVTKMVELESETRRAISDYKLIRCAVI